ncbi:hypothetical protein [Microbacterium sp. W4I20]|uniref:hypothetical protein n=1 Tax=Microbacterium sp. W4I20 TaxID=3042262 RepID=UPI00277EDD9B|nr:hypothetical protein [Microbacterium sp. W4I20]MDQ0726362.1 hypothetical protein [Microbacterium sp. W4I20]
MTRSEPRPLLGLLGALMFWGGLSFTLLFAGVFVWLLVTGSQPSWVLLGVTAAFCLVGLWLVRVSGVPLSEAMQL